MAAADTNVLLRLLVRDDPLQYRRAKAFLDEHAPLFVSKVALSEAVWVLTSAYRVDKTRACMAIEMLADVDLFRLEDAQIVISALGLYRVSALEFSDCLILSSARVAGELPLATFDRKLARLTGCERLSVAKR